MLFRSWFWKVFAPASNDLDPDRAVAYFRRGNYLEALRRADAIVAARPDVALGWRFHGECLFHMEFYEDAVESFGRAAGLGGEGTEDMFLWQALALHNDGQSEPAKQVIRNVLASGTGTPQLVAQAEGALAKLEAVS